MKTILQPARLVAICCGLGANLCAGQAKSSEPTTQELLEQIRSLQAQVNDLQARIAASQPTTQSIDRIDKETVDQVVRDATARSTLAGMSNLTAGYDPDLGFFIRSTDGNFLLHPWAFVQIRYATNYRENSTPSSSDTETGFELPRAKLIFDGNVFSRDLTYQIIWAASNTSGTVALQDAWVRYHIPETPWAVRAGQIRDPVDHEQLLYATRSLTPGRSIVDNVLLNGDDIVKGVSLGYGYDGNYPFRTEVAFTSGERNFDTTFEQFPTNPASWGVAGRFEYKLMGDWKDYTQFTSLNNKSPLLVLGGGIDYTEAGSTGQLTQVVDVQYALPSNLSFYAAYLGRYVSNNAGNPATNGAATGDVPTADTYDASVRLMASYLIHKHWEPFARFEWIDFDSFELPPDTDNIVYDLTAGFNYYFHGHRAKFSGAVSYLPNGCPVNATIDDVLASFGGNELILQMQLQFIF